MTIPIWIWILMVLACAVASYTDVTSTRIPNWLSLPILLVGILHDSTPQRERRGA